MVACCTKILEAKLENLLFGSSAHTLLRTLVHAVADDVVRRAPTLLRDCATLRAIFEAHKLPALLATTNIELFPIIQIIAGEMRVRCPALTSNRPLHVSNTLNVAAFALHFSIKNDLLTKG